jgi:hypothetical protein
MFNFLEISNITNILSIFAKNSLIFIRINMLIIKSNLMNKKGFLDYSNSNKISFFA